MIWKRSQDILSSSVSQKTRPRSRSSPLPNIDPLFANLAPNTEEKDAKKRTEAIDRLLKDDGAKRRRAAEEERRILLLGQAEAGKTTILKQMRILYNPQAHQQERDTWRLIVQLNTITSVRILVEAYEATVAEETPWTLSTRPADLTIQTALALPSSSTTGRMSGSPSSPSSPLSRSPTTTKNPQLLVRLRLAPLLKFEDELRTELGALGQHIAPKLDGHRHSAQPSWAPRDQSDGWKLNGTKVNDVFLPAGWTSKLNRSFSADKVLHASDQASTSASATSQRSLASRLRRACSHLGYREDCEKSKGRAPSKLAPSTPTPAAAAAVATPTSSTIPLAATVSQILNATKDDVQALWHAPFARRLCHQKNHSLLNAVGATDSTVYFLNDFDRIAQSDYQPSDQDILHARVRTVGVTEEVFAIEKGAKVRFFDVGGSTSQRFVWPSYIADFGIRAILFLVPLSAFDQQLAEDSRRNRLLDSLDLFEEVVQNPLLKDVTLVLFLNKMDLLEAKLKSGIQVKDHFPGYRGKNEYEDVWRYFRKKLRAIHDKAARHHHHQTQKQGGGGGGGAQMQRRSSFSTPQHASTSAVHTNAGRHGEAGRRAGAMLGGDTAPTGGGRASMSRGRYLYVHTTVAVSTKHIKAILCDVNDAILREHLNAAGLC